MKGLLTMYDHDVYQTVWPIALRVI